MKYENIFRLKIAAFISGMGVVFCATGYESPSCNFVWQTIVLAACAIVCFVCSYAVLKQEGKL